MKRFIITLSIIALGIATFSCKGNADGDKDKNGNAADSSAVAGNINLTAAAGSIVFFDLDRVISEFDSALEQKSVVETKINSIQQEVNKKGNSLQKQFNDFNEKINKGLYTRSTAEVKHQNLQKEQEKFQKFAAEKEQEIAEMQQVMFNNIAYDIKQYVDKFRVEHQYAMIISTQGNNLPAPVTSGDKSLDVTDAIIAGLNKEYTANKSAETE